MDRADVQDKLCVDVNGEVEEDVDAAKEEADFVAHGCRPPMIFRPFFFHAFEKPDKDSGMAEPQIICHDGSVRLLMGFFNKAKQDNLSAYHMGSRWRLASSDSSPPCPSNLKAGSTIST